MSDEADRQAGTRTRVSAFLFRHPGLRLGGLLGVPGLWFLVIYLGALVVMYATAFWHLDAFTGLVVRQFSLSNFKRIVDVPV
ncbi:MAG: ABC transporter permease, partial [Actinobacteria bacterium]